MRKFPLCAWCGESLARKGHVLIEYEDLPGKPIIGWHTELCAGQDSLFPLGNGKDVDSDGADALIQDIARRGMLRVTRT